MYQGIGEILREARMAAGVDISDLEQRTKIRAKYLRALENEEWSLLPGSTYVKSFLRGYAQELGLDARKIVEQYRLQYEQKRPDFVPISAAGHRAKQRQLQAQKRKLPLGLFALGGVLVGLVGLLFLLGRGGGEDKKNRASSPPATERNSVNGAAPTTQRSDRPHRLQRVKLSLVANEPVYVCLVNNQGKQLVARTLQAGVRLPTRSGKKFLLTLGNGSVRLYVNKKRVRIKPSSEPIGLRIDTRGVKPLSSTQRPTCTNG